MIHPKAMTNVRIISHSRNVRNVIETLYDLQMLHIVDFKKGGLDIGKPLHEASFYSEQLVEMRSIISRLALKGKPGRIKNIGDAQKKFAWLNKNFKGIATKLAALNEKENTLDEEINNPLSELEVTRDDVKDYKSLTSFIGTVKAPIEEKLSALTKDYLLIKKKIKKQAAFALFVPRGLAEQVREILSECGFSESRLAEIKKADAEAKLAEVRKEIDGLHAKLGEFKNNAQFLIDYEYALTQLNEKAEAPLRFGSSKSTFIASGWVPKDAADKLKQSLDKITNEKVSVEFLQAENAPTMLKNPNVINNFEFFLKLYSLPRYYELDPTVLMFFTFPLFFGFMLGDVGYGAVTLALALLLERKLPAAKPLLRIVTIASIASIAFGFIFGEAFGYEFMKHPILNRVHDINTMMLVSIAIGIVHVNFGFVLGFINELNHHSAIQSFFKKGSWITLQIGAVLAFFHLQSIGLAVMLVSVAMIIKGEGLRAVEIPTVLSNILSYLRLYAIGLASVSLAAVVNNMAFGLFAAGGFSIIAGILILLLGHAVNLMLGLLGPFLQSLRLHYVEFFQKFYEGGGYVYSPFGFVKRR